MAGCSGTSAFRPSWRGETAKSRAAMVSEPAVACDRASGKLAHDVRPTSAGGGDRLLRIGGKAVAGLARVEQEQAVRGDHEEGRVAGRGAPRGQPDRVGNPELRHVA